MKRPNEIYDVLKFLPRIIDNTNAQGLQKFGKDIDKILKYIDQLESENKDLKERVDKLQSFKDYVHKRLDDAGIEKEPNGEHSKHGCRIGDRLDLVLNQSIKNDT